MKQFNIIFSEMFFVKNWCQSFQLWTNRPVGSGCKVSKLENRSGDFLYEIFAFSLVFVGRREEAIDIVAKGVRWNGNGPLDKQYYLSKTKLISNPDNEDTSTASVGISDLFKTPNLRMKTLNVCFCW